MLLSLREVNPETLVETQDDELKPKDRKSVWLSVHTEFSSVEAIWRQFEKNADCFAFQTFDFLETWYEEIGCRQNVDLAIVVAWGLDAVPIMILPLGIEKSGFARKLTWLGNDVNDYNAPLLGPGFSERISPGDFPALWKDIVSFLPAHDLIELLRQPAEIDGQANPFLELPTQPNASGAHMTVLGADFDAYYEKKRNSKARRSMRSRRKKLEEMGDARYVHPATDRDIAASVAKLVELKSASLKTMGAKDFLGQPGYEEFYKALAVKSGAGGIAHVSHLEVAGEYVAGSWGLVHKRRFYYLLASYDRVRFGRYAPGVQALVEVMRWAVNKGVETFDFTIGDEPYKYEWCEIQSDLYDHLQAKTFRGALLLFKTKLLLALKRKIKHTPLLWETFTKLRTRIFGK
tara:strand:- start:90 stop:1301 length:1212 start_codon:yes stop_codon:yes gene_type:complete